MFLLASHTSSILHRFWDIVRYWLKIAVLIYPTWRPRWNLAEIFGHRKLVPELSYSVVCVIMCLAVIVELRLVTDRQTDGQTDARWQHIPRWYVVAWQKLVSLNPTRYSCRTSWQRKPSGNWLTRSFWKMFVKMGVFVASASRLSEMASSYVTSFA